MRHTRSKDKKNVAVNSNKSESSSDEPLSDLATKTINRKVIRNIIKNINIKFNFLIK